MTKKKAQFFKGEVIPPSGDIDLDLYAGTPIHPTAEGTTTITGLAGCTATLESSDVQVGSHSQLLTATTASGSFLLDFPYTLGKTYRLNFYAKQLTGSTARVYLVAPIHSTLLLGTTSATSWTEYTFEFEAQATGTGQGGLRIYPAFGGNIGDELLIDGLTVTELAPVLSADPNSPDFSWDAANVNVVGGDWIPDVKLPSGATSGSGWSTSLRTYVDVNGILQKQTTAGYRVDYSRGASDPYLLMESPSVNYAYPSEPIATPSIGSDSNVTYESYAWANGLTTAVRVLDNTVERSILYNFNTIPWASNSDSQKFICFVEMDDGSQPVIGTDFEIIMGGDNVLGGTVYEQQYGSTIWKVMGWTNNKAVGTPNDFGIKKLVTNNAKGFRVTGLQLSTNVNSSVTKYCDHYIKTTTTSLSTLRDEWQYVFGAGYTQGTLFLNMDVDANSGGNLFLVSDAGTTNHKAGLYWNSIRTSYTDPNGIGNTWTTVSSQKLTKVIITWDETGCYWYSDGVLKKTLDHVGLTPYEYLDKIKLYCSPYDGSDKVYFKKVQYWQQKMTEADALSYSII